LTPLRRLAHSAAVLFIAAPGSRGVSCLSEHRASAASPAHRAGRAASSHRRRLGPEPHRPDLLRVFAASLAGLVAAAAFVGGDARASEARLIAWTGAETGGTTAPAASVATGIVLDSITGERIALDARRGRPVVLHFFATWCEPCRAELPLLASFAAGRDDLITFAIDVGEVDIRVQRFAAQVGWTRPVLLDRDRAVARAFGVTALPTTIVLDAGLTPRLIAEGDLDWRNAAVTAPIVALATPTPDGRTPACTDATC
jgi:thiol-disulfide isomerase/thioredoxin